MTLQCLFLLMHLNTDPTHRVGGSFVDSEQTVLRENKCKVCQQGEQVLCLHAV